MQELAEVGVGGFSLNSVAARAGTAKRSIYARWPGRDELISAGLAELAITLQPPDTGELAEDLRQLFNQAVALLEEPRWSVLMRCAVELRGRPALHRQVREATVERSLKAVVSCLEEAHERGELREGVNTALVAESFVNTIVGFGTGTARSMEDVRAVREDLVGLLLGGLAAHR